jgi:hypothetical protein
MRSLVLVSLLFAAQVSYAREYYYERHNSNYRWSLFDGQSGTNEHSNVFTNPRDGIDTEMSLTYIATYGESRYHQDNASMIERASGERGNVQAFITNAVSRALNLSLPNIDIGYDYSISRTATASSSGYRMDLFSMQTNALNVRILGRSLHTSALYLKWGYTSLSGRDITASGENKLLKTGGGEVNLYLLKNIGLNMVQMSSKNHDDTILIDDKKGELFWHVGFMKFGGGFSHTEIKINDQKIKRDAGTLSSGLVL